MRTITTMLIVLILAVPAFAQEDTLIKGKLANGGYGTPIVKIGQVSDENGVFLGVEGGWVINHSLVIGGGIYGLVNDIEVGRTWFGEELYLSMAYGGVLVEYIPYAHKITHFNVHTLVGLGGISYRDKDNDHGDEFDNDSYFVLEPGIDLMLNVHKNIRFGIGATYRYVSGVDFENFSDDDLSDFNFQVLAKFGVF